MNHPVVRWLCVLVCGLSGCASLSPRPIPVAPVAQPDINQAELYLSLLAALSTGDPARQSDVFFDAEKNYTQAPTTVNTLRYAAALTVPGHPHSDSTQGRKLLQQLLASPERMSNTERYLAIALLNLADEGLKIQADNRRLVATVDEKSRGQANLERRAQSQADEIVKLRKSLDAAQQKLDAIRDIERSISERSTPPSGTRDSTNRDSASQTQTSPAGR